MVFRSKQPVDKSLNFDSRHNICCTLDKSLSKMKLIKEILDLIGRCQLKKALTGRHNVYRTHIEHFWTSERYEEEEKAIHSFAHVGKEDIEIIIKPADV
ncbi:hypothetical protein Hanom_Chr12g01136341 [Helianthus anomalus]